MRIKNYLSLLSIGAAALATGMQPTPASAVTCTTINLPNNGFNCGIARGRATLINNNERVRYSIETTTGALVSGVPVKADGVSVIPERAETGGGTCNTVRAADGLGSGAHFVERECAMVQVSAAKRYVLTG